MRPAVVCLCPSRVFAKTRLQGAATSCFPSSAASGCACFACSLARGSWKASRTRHLTHPLRQTGNRTLVATSCCILCLALLLLQFLFRDYFDELEPWGRCVPSFFESDFRFSLPHPFLRQLNCSSKCRIKCAI